MSSDDLASTIGVSTRTIRSYKQGTSAPSPPVLARIATALGVPVSHLAPLSEHPSLHELRWRAGLTVGSLAAVLDTGRGTASAILNGRARMDHAERWAQALGVSSADLEAATRVIPRRAEGAGCAPVSRILPPPHTWATPVLLASRRADQALSRRQLQVLQYLCSDLPTSAIAAELGVTRSTLRTHTRNIYARLGAAVVSRRAARQFVQRATDASVPMSKSIDSRWGPR